MPRFGFAGLSAADRGCRDSRHACLGALAHPVRDLRGCSFQRDGPKAANECSMDFVGRSGRRGHRHGGHRSMGDDVGLPNHHRLAGSTDDPARKGLGLGRFSDARGYRSARLGPQSRYMLGHW